MTSDERNGRSQQSGVRSQKEDRPAEAAAVGKKRHRSLPVAALMVCLAGCGVPGEPLPPLLEIPAPVEDLAAAQVGAEVVVEWSRPRLTTEGTRPQRFERIELYASFHPQDTPAPDVPESAGPLSILPAAGTPETEERMRDVIRLEPSQRGTQAVIAVKALNDRGRDAGFSNVVTLTIADLPELPANLQGEVTEQAVRLRWTPAGQSVFGGEAPPTDGYQVFRNDAGLPGPGAMIGEAQGPEYQDTAFEFERTYVYSVRAFVRRGNAAAVTPLSSPAQIAATDRFPPKAPENVRAVATPGAIEIAWSPNEEEDLAGYHVYRSEGGEFARLHAEPLRIPVFRDATVRPGTRYRYQVRAADRRGNESDPSEEIAMLAE